jgi:DNA-binding NarL/FixJ family response regulator
MSQKIRIVIAEDEELFRKSLIALLKTNQELEVVAEAANGRELIEHLKQMHTDIVLLNPGMPVMNGKAALEILHQRFPKVKVIILSIHSDTRIKSEYMAYGANSYLYKTCDVQTLFKAIRIVKSEGYFFDNSTSKALLDSVLKDRQRTYLHSEVKFNERETEILKGICDGKTNKEIALSLHLSASTIDFYRTKIYSKTKCNNVARLLKYALKNGLVLFP